MISKKLLSLISVLSLASGCAVVDAYQFANQTIFSPTDIDVSIVEHNTHYKKPSNGQGSLYVIWKASKLTGHGAMSGVYIYIDGKQAGALTRNTYTVVDLEPGTYMISVGDSSSQNNNKSIRIAKNQSIYYSTGIRNNLVTADELYLQKFSDEKSAKESMTKLIYVTPKS